MKLTDYLAGLLRDVYGVRHVFTVTGGGALHLNDSFGKIKGITSIYNHHEQASAIAAEAYARLINNIGVCVVTTGPGSTNTFTGLIGAWLDSIPMLIISGQVKREVSIYQYPLLKLRQLGVQEVDVIGMATPVTKYAKTIMDPSDIRYEIEKAMFVAKSGRPGPVWLDIPLDVQGSIVEPQKLRSFNPKTMTPRANLSLLHHQIEKTLSYINKAKRPVIVAGFGIRQADVVRMFHEMISRLRIPVVTALAAHDLMWEKHPFYAGRFGLYGTRGGNFTVQNSDVLLVLGCRMNLWETGHDYKSFAREAKKIMVDIDKSELAKPTFKPDLAVNADLRLFMPEILRRVKKQPHRNFDEWVTTTKSWHKRYPNILPEYKKETKFVNIYHFMGILSDLLEKKDVIVTGNGTSFTATCQSIQLKKDQRLAINIGCASMGYDLPAAIGAFFATNRNKIVLITGDGSVQMNIQELQTIVHNRIPIKIFVLNNDGYLAIRITQTNFFNRLFGTDKQHGLSFPDTLKIARAYGLPAVRIKTQKNLRAKLKKILSSAGPVICEIMIPPNQPLIPKPTTVIKSDGTFVSKPLEDMYPFLPREEFMKNMFIMPVNTEI